jgi:hypothetical protein
MELSDDKEISTDDCKPSDWTKERLLKLKSLCSPDLQTYIDLPPGDGMAIVYVIFNIKDGKMYVGKHCHASIGKSFKESRLGDHIRPPSKRDTFFARAVRKHGELAFLPFILWHGLESDANASEVHWISPLGLHTRIDDGGWGYNLREGGDGGHHSRQSITKMIETMSTDEFKQKRSEKVLDWQANETTEHRDARYAKIRQTSNAEQYVSIKRESQKRWLATESTSSKSSRWEKIRATQRSNGHREHISKVTLLGWQKISDEAKQQRISKRQMTVERNFELSLQGLSVDEQRRRRIERSKKVASARRRSRIVAVARAYTKNSRLQPKEAFDLLRSGVIKDPGDGD